MSKYILSFAKRNLVGKTDEYLFLLWVTYKASMRSGRISDSIKQRLSSVNTEALTKDYQKLASRLHRILTTKPELDWVAPSGLNQLKILQVKNFRGFGEITSDDKGSVFRLSRGKNIFYAPNGGGKTSLCEALEYGITGHIKEADRRKTKIRHYISRSNLKPLVKIYDATNSEVVTSLTWANCFIDRNRLQEFSLLGSKDTGSAEKDVLAVLFGLEEYQTLLSRFVLPPSFNLQTFKKVVSADTLELIKSERAIHHERIVHYNRSIEKCNESACDLLQIHRKKQGEIKSKYGLLKKLLKKKNERFKSLASPEGPAYSKKNTLEAFVKISTKLLLSKKEIDNQYLENAGNINYQAIFSAIKNLYELDGDSEYCPACLTPVLETKINPFHRATAELEKLHFLSKIQSNEQALNIRLVKCGSFIGEIVKALDMNVSTGVEHDFEISALRDALENFNVATDRSATSIKLIEEYLAVYRAMPDQVEKYVLLCEEKELEKIAFNEKKVALEKQITTLQAIIERLLEISNEKNQYIESIKVERINLTRLHARYKKLWIDSDSYKKYNSLLDNVTLAYKDLYQDLMGFKVDLESQRLAGIETKAAQYYQQINTHDEDHEKIKSLNFEKQSDGYRIIITTLLDEHLDAFSVLSEGHLRALGLSILLAMAEKNQLPIIVFDDVVNAIDSDHRSNIINLIFSDDYLRKVQMIITTHDRLFWERFCSISEKVSDADQNSSLILKYSNKGIIFFDYAGGFRNKIEYAMSVFDVRQALIYCRIWFETMAIEYCIENKIHVTAQFTASNYLKRNNHLQISLEKTFRLIEENISYDKRYFDLIKNDLINWGGQNQEHHAFDEFGFNFVHSKTSDEISKIYDAIRMLECQLFLERKKISCNERKIDLDQRIVREQNKIANLNAAPAHTQENAARRLRALQKHYGNNQEELQFIAQCELTTSAIVALHAPELGSN
jgi:DNA sulfur modification protein DndD